MKKSALLQVRFPDEKKTKILEIARQEDKSLSQVLRDAINYYLKQNYEF